MVKKSFRLLLGVVFLLIAAGCQNQEPQNTQPYAGLETREIKAMSEERKRAILNGEGAQYALAAELNHYPGPAHLLDWKEELDLTEEQLAVLQEEYDKMSREAKKLGKQLVDLERRLDRAFAEQTIDDQKLKKMVEEAAEVEAQLRYTHLRTHLKTKELLTEKQIQRYDELRGYQDHSDAHGSSHGNNHHE